jgi:hypothetical protein
MRRGRDRVRESRGCDTIPLGFEKTLGLDEEVSET